MRTGTAAFIPALMAGVVLAVQSVTAATVKVDYDRAFDFKAARTWGWHPDGRGEVRMAGTLDDNPAAVQKRVEPIIVAAVEAEMAKRGLQFTPDAPDVAVVYYLLITTGVSAQTIGQFIPAVPYWGLPPLAPATQSFEMKNHGALVLDISAKRAVVWRGVARASSKIDAETSKRETMLRGAVRDLVKRFPPKS